MGGTRYEYRSGQAAAFPDSVTDGRGGTSFCLDSLLPDGLHPNDAGYEIMYRLLLKELEIASAIV